MKKFKSLALLLAIGMTFGLAGCGKEEAKATTEKKEEVTTVEATTEDSGASDDTSSHPSVPGDTKGLKLAEAIRDTRGVEDNEIFEIVCMNEDGSYSLLCGPADDWDQAAIDSQGELVFNFLGLTDDDLKYAAISISTMNVRSYAIGVFVPEEGKEEVVMEAMNNYIQLQKDNMNLYLDDQYKIACDTKLDKTADGKIVIVMTDGQDEIFDSLISNLQ